MTAAPEHAEKFIGRWQAREGGQERANYGLFLTELCDVLGLPHPDPAGATNEYNDYVFERRVTSEADGELASGRTDLYRRGCSCSFSVLKKITRNLGARPHEP